MNRSQRRAAVARGNTTVHSTPSDIAGLMVDANLAYQQGRLEQAEVLCKQVLRRDPKHKDCLSILGAINQGLGRHRLAVKKFAEVLALDEFDGACHFNIGRSYQTMGQLALADAHFRKAILFDMGGKKDIEEFVVENPVIARCIAVIARQVTLQLETKVLFDDRDIGAIAGDVFLRCALEMTIIRGAALEVFLTHLRFVLLSLAGVHLADPLQVGEEVVNLFCALAQQCFINEYVFAQSAAETRQAAGLRDRLLEKMASGEEISSLLLAAVGAYYPLHSLPGSELLLAADWPASAAGVLRRQIREPLEERGDHPNIPALTAIDDAVSIRVREQYEDNPYPCWTINRLAMLSDDAKKQIGAAHSYTSGSIGEILVAGCGTGQHAIEMAQYFPDARILAIDISKASLAYARRKTRELGLCNVEYAQADILQLGSLGRTFDRIGAVGVLHHLADPEAGWRILLSLLCPRGVMRIGLYSEIARAPVVEARTRIAQRGYRASAEDMRAFRQTIIREADNPRWKMLLSGDDFYSMSGCRDLLFNVMVHRFTIPQIASFLDGQGLSFLGFEVAASVFAKFHQQYPAAGAPTNLDYWHAFEIANPQTFRQMYSFSVRKNEHRPA